ncbi:MAG: proline dehydrogenase family protein [Bacteroidales bacterium]|nr:proline dehydrogenase family protein [Bacteroidales bacterium]
MISFDNTEIAFKSKTDKDLKRAFLLFRLIGNNFLVNAGKHLAGMAIKARIPMDWVVKPTIYKQFIGGENIGDCNKVVRLLERFRVKAILDYSVEGSESPEDIANTLEETIRTINNASGDPNVAFAVFKPTAFTTETVLGEKSAGLELTGAGEEEAGRFRQRVRTLCQAAFDKGIPILIDAEETRFQNFIDEVVFDNMLLFNRERAIVYNTYQMYRRDRLEVLRRDYRRAESEGIFLGAKFVRGAYMEKERQRAAELGYPDPIHPDQESTDKAYNEALRFCASHIDRIYIFNGTHNEYSSGLLAELMDQYDIPRDDPRCFFSQLYGMSDHISFNLAFAGYNVAKYIPYGPVRSVLPYLIRRTEENTSIAGQTGRELGLITMELRRRKGHLR